MKHARFWIMMLLCLPSGLQLNAEPPARSYADLHALDEPGLGAPELQRQAGEWLYLKIVTVQRSGAAVRAIAVVLKPFVSTTGLALGDVIYVDYTLVPPDFPVEEERSPLVGFGTSPPLVANGELTFAFLRHQEEYVYLPAAEAWSFAPPVGIWPEVRIALEMDPSVDSPATMVTTLKSETDKGIRTRADIAEVSIFLQASKAVAVKVTSKPTDSIVFAGNLRPGDYFGVTGKPPFELVASSFEGLTVELPNRSVVQPANGADFGTFQVPENGAVLEPPITPAEEARAIAGVPAPAPVPVIGPQPPPAPEAAETETASP